MSETDAPTDGGAQDFIREAIREDRRTRRHDTIVTRRAVSPIKQGLPATGFERGARDLHRVAHLEVLDRAL